MSSSVDQSAIPPLIVFEEPLASFTSCYAASTSQSSQPSSSACPSRSSSSPPSAPPAPLVVTALCFDEVASDVVLITNENTICFYHIALGADRPLPGTTTSPLSSPDAKEEELRLSSMTELALCVTVQRRAHSFSSARTGPPGSTTTASRNVRDEDAQTSALVPVRAARRCPTTFYAPTTEARHAEPLCTHLAEAEAASQLLAYQIVAVSCEASAIYFYRCFNAQSELTEAALHTAAGESGRPLAAFALYQCVPNNIRFSDPCYPIHSFYWVAPSEGTTAPANCSALPAGPASQVPEEAEGEGEQPLSLSEAASWTSSPRLLCITTIGLELVRFGTVAELSSAAYHQSTHGADGLPTVLTLHGPARASSANSNNATPASRFARRLISGWAVQERYPTRVHHWHFHPSTRLLLTVRESEDNAKSLQRVQSLHQQQAQQQGYAQSSARSPVPPDVTFSVVVKPFEISPARLRPMCRLELPLRSCHDLVRALHESHQTQTPAASIPAAASHARTSSAHFAPPPHVEDPRMLVSRALSAHLGVVCLYGKVFLYHVVACDAVLMLYQYCTSTPKQESVSVTTRAESSGRGAGASFHVTHTQARPPQPSSPPSTSAALAALGDASEYYVRRLALDLRCFAAFREYRDLHDDPQSGLTQRLPLPPPPPPPPLVVQVSDNMLVLHSINDAMSAVFDIAGLSACVEAEQLVGALPQSSDSMVPSSHTMGPIVLRMNAVVGQHARPVSLPCSMPPQSTTSAWDEQAAATATAAGEDWASVPPSSGFTSRIQSVAQSLHRLGGPSEGVGAGLGSSWASSDSLVSPTSRWTNTRSAPMPAASTSATSSTTPTRRRRRIPIGLHIYATTCVALSPGTSGATGTAAASGFVESGTPASPLRTSTSLAPQSKRKEGSGGGGGFSWLLGKLPTSLTGLDSSNPTPSSEAMFGTPTPLCRAELQMNTPVPLLPALVTAPLVAYAASPATTTMTKLTAASAHDVDFQPRRWYESCRFSQDASTLPLLFDARAVVNRAGAEQPTRDARSPHSPVLFSAHLVHVSPFAVAAAASSRLSGPFLAMTRSQSSDLDAETATHAPELSGLVGRDVAWRAAFYSRRLFCGGEAIPRLLRTMLRCTETVVESSSGSCTYSPEACSADAIAAALSATVAQQAYTRQARLAYASLLSGLGGNAAGQVCLSEWQVNPGPALGMPAAALTRLLRAASQTHTQGALLHTPFTGACECRVFTNHPDRAHETRSYLAAFTASPQQKSSSPPSRTHFLTLMAVLATSLLPQSLSVPPYGDGSPGSDQASSYSTLCSPSSISSPPPLPHTTTTTTNPARTGEGGGGVLRVFRQLPQRLMVELVLRPAVQYAQAWAEQIRQSSQIPSDGASAASIALPAPCRERFAFLCAVLLSYSAAVRDVGEVPSDDVQGLIVVVLLEVFASSLKSLARAVQKCLRRGLLTDQLATALRLLQYRDAWVAAHAQAAYADPNSPPGSPLQLFNSSSGGFDGHHQIQDPLSPIVMGILARCGGVYERIAVWLRRRDPLRAARDLCRYAAAAAPYTQLPDDAAPFTAEGIASPVFTELVLSAEEDMNLLLASQDILQCAASCVDAAEMGLMGPRRRSGGLGTAASAPRQASNAAGGVGGGESWLNNNSSSSYILHSLTGATTTGGTTGAATVSPQQESLAALQEHASRKSRQRDLQARRKAFVLAFQLVSVLARGRISACYSRLASVEAHFGPILAVEETQEGHVLVTSSRVAEKMEVKLMEYERRFIAGLHS